MLWSVCLCFSYILYKISLASLQAPFHSKNFVPRDKWLLVGAADREQGVEYDCIQYNFFLSDSPENIEDRTSEANLFVYILGKFKDRITEFS